MVVVHGVDDDDVLEVVGNRVSFSLGWIATVAVVIQFIGECANFSLALPLLDVMDDFLGLRGKEVGFSLATMSNSCLQLFFVSIVILNSFVSFCFS